MFVRGWRTPGKYVQKNIQDGGTSESAGCKHSQPRTFENRCAPIRGSHIVSRISRFLPSAEDTPRRPRSKFDSVQFSSCHLCRATATPVAPPDIPIPLPIDPAAASPLDPRGAVALPGAGASSSLQTYRLFRSTALLHIGMTQTISPCTAAKEENQADSSE